MILKYCESESDSVCIQEIYKVSQTTIDDENGNKFWVLYFFATNLMERIDVYVPSFSKGAELMTELYDNNRLDISACADLVVEVLNCSTTLEQLFEDAPDSDLDLDDIDYDDPNILLGF